MADIINTPAGNDTGGIGVLSGSIVLFLIIGMLFIFYGLPAMRGTSQTSVPGAEIEQVRNTEVGDRSTIEIPDEIDVNVNQPE